jgi:hypothetical protein
MKKLTKINGTNFDLEFCRLHSPEKLRKIYEGESKKTLDMLIETLKPKAKTKK